MEPNDTSPELIRLTVRGVVNDPNTETMIIILRDEEKAEVLPIWVGTAEGNAIRFALQSIATQRPMSHDLLRSLVEHLNLKVSRVVVTDVKNNTYYASVHLVSREAEWAIDSRPSDAIALALRTNSPIYAKSDVLKQRGGNLDAWLERLDAKHFGKFEV
jgi:bifunctional DNase/RNase